MVNKKVFDIGITILFLILNIILTLYNKSIYHSNDLIIFKNASTPPALPNRASQFQLLLQPIDKWLRFIG